MHVVSGSPETVPPAARHFVWESGAGPPGRTALGSITRVRIAWALVSFGCMGPFFYPVTNEAYATELARDWNTKYEASGWTGYVLT